MKKKLYLSLKKQWFELIKSGIKKEEYRELNQYWINRLCVFNKETESNDIKHFDEVEFSLGYPKKDDKEKRMIFEINNITISEKGKEEWGG